MRTIAIVNQKGGCGKTTTAISLAATFARRGQRTLLLDMDPQSHCAAGLGVPEDRIECSVGEAMVADRPEHVDPAPLVWEVARNLHLAPSTMRLAALEAPGGGLHELPDRDRRLERLLEGLAPSFDLCLIDCPPTVGLLTFNALRAAREVIVPVETGYFALKGAQKQWETIQRVIRRIGRPIACHVLPTLFDPTSDLACDILASLRRTFAGQIVPVAIRERDELREAASVGQAVIEYAPGSEACSDYEMLADWLVEHDVRDETQLAERVATVDIEIVDHAGTTMIARRGLGYGEMAGGDGGRAGELAERLRMIAGTRGTGAARSPMFGAAAAELRIVESTPAVGPIPAPPPVIDLDPHAAPAPVPAISPEPIVQPATPAARPAIPPPAPAYGVCTTDRGARFVQPAGGQQSVHIAGDFNQWRPAETPMRHNAETGVFETHVPLTPGRYLYRLVVDGRWQADPYNTAAERNEHDEANSVLVVPGQIAGQIPGRLPGQITGGQEPVAPPAVTH